MKKSIIYNSVLIIFLFGIIITFCACEYKDIIDVDYPEQFIYLPAAKSGVFVVDKVIDPVGSTTAGSLYRFTLNNFTGKFIIPLAVYRSGIDNKGNIDVNIQVNEDTIIKLQGISGVLPDNTILLPSNVYSLIPSVVIKDGEEIAEFELSINSDFLSQNHGKIYAIGVTVSSPNRKTNKSLETTVLVINTSFLKPINSFTYNPDVTNDKMIKFTNTTLYSSDYTWDFGDGSPISTEVSPTHTYANYGTYTVKLTANGLIGKSESEKALTIWENITNTYFPNPGNPFVRSDNRTSKTGNLKDWSFTSNVQSNGYGGFYLDNGVGVMDFYSTLGLTNAKIYRTIDLPVGSYRVGFKNAGFIGTNDCYFIVAIGSDIPDIQEIETSPSVLAKYHWNTDILTSTNEISFQLIEPKQITIGFVVTNTPRSEIKINSVFLYR